jgi:hypothetical protein
MRHNNNFPQVPGPIAKQKKRPSLVDHAERSQSILAENVLCPTNDSAKDPEGTSSDDVRKRKVSLAQGKPVDTSKQKKQKKASANAEDSEDSNNSTSNNGRARDPVMAIPSSRPLPFAEQLVGALTKSSGTSRYCFEYD